MKTWNGLEESRLIFFLFKKHHTSENESLKKKNTFKFNCLSSAIIPKRPKFQTLHKKLKRVGDRDGGRQRGKRRGEKQSQAGEN